MVAGADVNQPAQHTVGKSKGSPYIILSLKKD
jgi:hypothetical protein